MLKRTPFHSGATQELSANQYKVHTDIPISFTGCLQTNGAVSKVNKIFISHLTRGKTYTVSSGNCPSFSCATSSSLARAYCGVAGPVSKMASQQEKAFCVLRFEVSRSVITV